MNTSKQHILLLVASLFMVLGQLEAQTTFKPQNLGSAVNSEYSEFNPVISADGKTLYFNRANHPSNTYGRINSQDVWFSQLRDNGTWTEAERLPRTVNIGRYNTFLSALNDGKTFLINGIYNRKGTRWIGRGFSLIERVDDDRWGKPVKLSVSGYSRMNRGRVTSAYMTSDREYLLMAFAKKPNSRRLSLYISKRKDDHRYEKPQKLKGGVNTARSSESPFLSSDGNALYFAGNFGGGRDNDIYMCNRSADSYEKWSKPVPLSDIINTANWDSYYKLNPKGSWAFFSSLTNSLGKADIFRVKIFEEFPYVKLTGLILNQADQTLMLSDTSYQVQINGKPFPGLKVDKASASYEVLLPFGEVYSLKPEMLKWNGLSNDVDLRGVKEYSETKLNLYLTSIPYVQVKGKIINTRTNMPVSLEKNPRVFIDSIFTDSVKYDQFSASYQVLLPLGAKYPFRAQVANFIGKVDTVDVLRETIFQERELDLYIASVPWVEVKGIAMDNSSFTPILGNSIPKLILDGAQLDSISIDPTTGEFTIRLPFGKKYLASITANDFNTLENWLDLSGYVEFTVVKHNIFAERRDANMAILSGKVINTKTEKPLEPGTVVQMKVNEVVSKAFKYDSTTASYSLKLPTGYSYDLTPSVYNHYNKYDQLDLTKVAPMTKIARNFYVTPIEVGQSVDIEFIYFETGKSGLKPESFRSLNALVSFLNEYPNVKVEIGGHTDNTGSSEVNLKISEQRARAVGEYVISMGVRASRIESKGYGLTKPKFNNKTADGRAKNRRVEFTITGI